MSRMGRMLVVALGLLAVACLAGRTAAADAPAATPAASLWTDDFEAAKAQAKKEGKDLLVDFTGSDWCGWCIKLKAEVFDKEKFKTEAPKKFVLVELDFPQKKKLDEATKKQNDALQKQYQINGFPTILLMDADGKVYAKTGYQAGGEEKYLAHLDELQKSHVDRDKALAEAEKANGLDRAKALDKVLEAEARLGNDPLGSRPLVDEIIKLDEKNEAGLKAKYEQIVALSEADKLAQKGKFAEAVAAADKVVTDYKPTGEALQNALFIKGFCQFRLGNKDEALKTLQAAVDAAPKSEKTEYLQNAIKVIGSQPKAPATSKAKE
jgi:thioredoxin-related protein